MAGAAAILRRAPFVTKMHGAQTTSGSRIRRGSTYAETSPGALRAMRITFIPFLLSVSAPALAFTRPVVADVTPVSDGSADVGLLFVNAEPTAAPAAPPRLAASLRIGGETRTVELVRAAAATTIAPGGFERAVYHLALPAGVRGEAMLSLAGPGGYAFVLPAAAAPKAGLADAASVRARPAPVFTVPPGAAQPAILGNLMTYNPIYGTFGPGTDSDGKLELSFQYQLFGDAARPTGAWKEGFRLAYTQTMYWDLGARSKPFRDVNYSPELYYRYAFAQPLLGAAASLRGGFQHLSNGRAGDASRSVNWFYVEPQGIWRTHGVIVTAAPRYLVYVGSDSDNPGIARQRGHQALAFSVEQPDGLKLATQSRLNFGAGHGAIDADLSYPLLRLAGVPLYAVLQGFTGYGEDLRDYNRKESRLRFGLGIAR